MIPSGSSSMLRHSWADTKWLHLPSSCFPVGWRPISISTTRTTNCWSASFRTTFTSTRTRRLSPPMNGHGGPHSGQRRLRISRQPGLSSPSDMENHGQPTSFGPPADAPAIREPAPSHGHSPHTPGSYRAPGPLISTTPAADCSVTLPARRSQATASTFRRTSRSGPIQARRPSARARLPSMPGCAG